jgi:hypothetical protein
MLSLDGDFFGNGFFIFRSFGSASSPLLIIVDILRFLIILMDSIIVSISDMRISRLRTVIPIVFALLFLFAVLVHHLILVPVVLYLVNFIYYHSVLFIRDEISIVFLDAANLNFLQNVLNINLGPMRRLEYKMRVSVGNLLYNFSYILHKKYPISQKHYWQ